MSVVLSTDLVTKQYELDKNVITAVDQVTLDIKAGEFTGQHRGKERHQQHCTQHLGQLGIHHGLSSLELNHASRLGLLGCLLSPIYFNN